jgi:CRISPR-associated protein Cmx8
MTVEIVQLTYQLAQLPGAPYRAGLAGLIFLNNFLHRKQPEIRDQITVLYDSTSASLQCNRDGLQALIDLAFDARIEGGQSRQSAENQEVSATHEILEDVDSDLEDDEEAEEGRLRVLAEALAERDTTGLWTSLWSDWLLSVVRTRHLSRLALKARAELQPVSIKKIWEGLQKSEKRDGLTSSALIGAEAKTAESVQLSNTYAQTFLLNFWPYVSQPYIPCRFDADGKRENWGFTVAIPDVQDLEAFVRQFPEILERRPRNSPNDQSYRPRGALIELPEEAALDSIRLIRQYMQETQIASSLEFDVLGFEVCHATRPDPRKGADLVSIAYIQPDSERDSRYELYRDNFWCPWFKRHLLQNLVKNRPWTARWGGLLSTASQKWFEDRYFPHDCQLVFNSEENIVETSELIQILKSLCDRYLNARLAIKGHDSKNWEERHKLARQEFLAVRARPQKDAFRKYFFETLCSQVTPVLLKKGLSGEQQSAEKIRQMLLISEALDKDTETVRGLTMLALASNFQIAERSNSSAEG